MDETPQDTQSNKMPFVIGAVVLIILVGFVAMKLLSKNAKTTSDVNMTKKQMTTQAPSSASPTSSPSGDVMTAETNDVKTITLDAGSFYYSIKTISLKKGQKVKVVMTSKDMMHDFNIDELNVHMPIVKSGETGTVTFTADKVGTFEYYCSVGNHRQLGMKGTLTVK